MKKITIFIAIIILILCLNKEETIVIPKEAIRFRVIANSNEEEDQQIKKEVVKSLKEDIKSIPFSKNIKSTRKVIKRELPKFNDTVKKTINSNNYSINYGLNYFPRKEYKGITYEEGEYESVVVTLGDGKGENFWCVLFPPLCLVDDENTDYEYTSIISELINKYFK